MGDLSRVEDPAGWISLVGTEASRAALIASFALAVLGCCPFWARGSQSLGHQRPATQQPLGMSEKRASDLAAEGT